LSIVHTHLKVYRPATRRGMPRHLPTCKEFMLLHLFLIVNRYKPTEIYILSSFPRMTSRSNVFTIGKDCWLVICAPS